jgi:hypothetical protein
MYRGFRVFVAVAAVAVAGADEGVFILPRHAGTTTQAEEHCCGGYTERETLHRFHWITSF